MAIRKQFVARSSLLVYLSLGLLLMGRFVVHGGWLRGGLREAGMLSLNAAIVVLFLDRRTARAECS